MAKNLFVSLGIWGLTLSVIPSTALVAQAAGRRYEVTVANLTPGQNLTPAVVVTHNEDFQPLFTVGEPASPELALIARGCRRWADGRFTDSRTRM